MNSGNIRIWD